MKKRILFVDDEPMVLEGLRRMLRGMRGEWDMEFLDGGARALDYMSRESVDVVVADMLMPGMNGAELLNEVMRRHPNTVRLILSGHADKDLILQCVGSTHQYLAKPCDPDALKTMILRASKMDSTLQSASLRGLVGQMSRLPSMPALYTEIVERANEPDVALDDVAQIITRDPGMTAKILKLVNSAFFGLSRELSSTEDAVAYIGLDTIKSLVLTLHAFSEFDQVEPAGFTMDSLWSHSLTVAGLSKRIAIAENANRSRVDEAFTAGMLHDVGKLVLAANLPEPFAEAVRIADETRLGFWSAEEQVFGANHADVGGYLLGLWGLPVSVVEAIALHHCPDKAPSHQFAPLTAVHVANVLAHEASGNGSVGTPPQLNALHLAGLDLSERVPVWSESLKNP